MPITDMLIVSAIITAFTIFAVTLAWGDYQTREIAQASRERAAANINVVPLRQDAAPPKAAPVVQEKKASAA